MGWRPGISVAASAVEYLAKDQHKIETFSFYVLDGNGGSVLHTVSVDITDTADDVDGPDGVHFLLATGKSSASENEGNLKEGHNVGSFVAFGDIDPIGDDTFTYVLGSSSSPNFALSPAGVLSVATNNTGSGAYEISVIAEDSFGHESTPTDYTIWIGTNSNDGTTVQSFAESENSVIAFGVNGDETIIGSAFDDALSGAKGDDTLNGGGGNDILLGCSGSDTFIFAPNCDHDIVTEFVSGADTIDASSLH